MVPCHKVRQTYVLREGSAVAHRVKLLSEVRAAQGCSMWGYHKAGQEEMRLCSKFTSVLLRAENERCRGLGLDSPGHRSSVWVLYGLAVCSSPPGHSLQSDLSARSSEIHGSRQCSCSILGQKPLQCTLPPAGPALGARGGGLSQQKTARMEIVKSSVGAELESAG